MGRFQKFSPLRIPGKGMQFGADAMRASAPLVSMAGDSVVDAASPVLEGVGSALGNAAGSSLGSLIGSVVPIAGTSAGAAVLGGMGGAGGAIGTKLATQAPKILGRMGYGMASQALGTGGQLLDKGLGANTQADTAANTLSMRNMGMPESPGGGAGDGAGDALKAMASPLASQPSRVDPGASPMQRPGASSIKGSGNTPGADAVREFPWPPEEVGPPMPSHMTGGAVGSDEMFDIIKRRGRPRFASKPIY